MINAGPSQGMLARRNMGGIPARQPQPMPNMGQPPMGQPMGGPSRGMQPMPTMPMMRSNPEIPNGGLNIGPSPDLSAKLGMNHMLPQPSPMPSPSVLEGGPAQLNMPIANTPPMDVQQPMKFGGMPMNIGGPDTPQTRPLWQRYAMMNRGM